MKHCPCCEEGARHYRLSDGRLKCRACGQRFSWTSVWDSVRLSSAVKHRLLELFALGVPSYRQRFRSDTSAPAQSGSIDCCALAVPKPSACESRSRVPSNAVKPPLAGPERASGAGARPTFGLVKRNGRVKAMPIPLHNRASIMQEIDAHTREGAPYYTDDRQAYATLKLRGDHVMIRKQKGRPVGRGVNPTGWTPWSSPWGSLQFCVEINTPPDVRVIGRDFLLLEFDTFSCQNKRLSVKAAETRL